MFAFVKERKALAALSALVSSTPATVAAATSVERSAGFILCNVMLFVGAKAWGREVTTAPQRLPRQVAVDAVCTLADEHARLAAAAVSTDGRSIDDPMVRAVRWEIMANEVVALTLGSGLDAEANRAMRKCWETMWGSRGSLDEALKTMAHYAKAYSVEPTPRISGKRPSQDTLRKFGSVLPPMFQSRKPAK